MREFPASLLAAIQRQTAEMGRCPATGIERVPDLAAAIAVAPGAGQFIESAAPPLRFQEHGFVIAMYGQERTGTQAKFASLEMRLQMNSNGRPGTRDLIRSGVNGGGFFPFLGFFGPLCNWFSLIRRVEKGDIWQVTYRNFDTGAVANPSVGFAFLSDAEVDALASG